MQFCIITGEKITLGGPSCLSLFYYSRAHSPGMAAPSFSGATRFNTSFHSPPPRGHHGLLPSPNSTVNETTLVPEMEPIVPDLCMEQLWSETATAGCQRSQPGLIVLENKSRACMDKTFSHISCYLQLMLFLCLLLFGYSFLYKYGRIFGILIILASANFSNCKEIPEHAPNC